ncbi:MAG TPA: indole-3-glycerol phosphate synthase TrpC [Gemmatimonadetes bacterium]|nr:indole-3-glycerol phosphate synthase TrpC [Gemmatimonadota bacterium]
MRPPEDILQRIVETKREEVEALRGSRSELRDRAEAAPPPRDFAGALAGRGAVAVIAEIKRRSPGAGAIRMDLDPIGLGPMYESGGAAALSVLTDREYFGGSLEDLSTVRDLVNIPILRKDFVIDESQVFEARAAGADAILLIVRILDDERLRSLRTVAEELGMSVLVEAHDGAEVQRGLDTGARLLGINNRNLQTFEARIDVTLSLADRVPSDVALVSESGIHTAADVRSVGEVGVDAVLVGESLLRQEDPGEGVTALAGQEKASR